ncbi:hypothetical protein O181_008176 [Austropuccinia psidii MF-1]|uniref:Uncharacterized protein n=1 Tax=Austropuccinia psidii MF-1 TaxID=1389203 RepID=A0A9Q3GIA0_9BASI|nr:hypothetical protein [Austropuccinia psidii MF-1]
MNTIISPSFQPDITPKIDISQEDSLQSIQSQAEGSSHVTHDKNKRYRRTKAQIDYDNKIKQTQIEYENKMKELHEAKERDKGAIYHQNPQFVREDYERICTYIENPDHYNDLFGEINHRSTWGSKKITRIQAYENFAKHLNLNHSKGTLKLDGRKLQQRWSTFKKRYLEAVKILNDYGSKVQSNEYSEFIGALEARCPCFERMHKIFGDKLSSPVSFNLDKLKPSVTENSKNQAGNYSGQLHPQEASSRLAGNLIHLNECLPRDSITLDEQNDGSDSPQDTYFDDSPQSSDEDDNLTSSPEDSHQSNETLSQILSHPKKRLSTRNPTSKGHKLPKLSESEKSSVIGAITELIAAKQLLLTQQIEFRRERAQKEDEFRSLELENKKVEIETQKQALLRADRLAAVNQWVIQGRSVTDIEGLLKMTFN